MQFPPRIRRLLCQWMKFKRPKPSAERKLGGKAEALDPRGSI